MFGLLRLEKWLYSSNLQELDTFDLLTLSEQQGYLSPEFLEFLLAEGHGDAFALDCHHFKNNLRSQHLVEHVGRDNHVDFPLDAREAKRFLAKCLALVDGINWNQRLLDL